jgi:hypothetical protein
MESSTSTRVSPHGRQRTPGISRRTIVAATNAWAVPAVVAVLASPLATASTPTFHSLLRFDGQQDTPSDPNGISARVPARLVLRNLGPNPLPVGTWFSLGAGTLSHLLTVDFNASAAQALPPVTRSDQSDTDVIFTPRSALAPGGVLEVPLVVRIRPGVRPDRDWAEDADYHEQAFYAEMSRFPGDDAWLTDDDWFTVGAAEFSVNGVVVP